MKRLLHPFVLILLAGTATALAVLILATPVFQASPVSAASPPPAASDEGGKEPQCVAGNQGFAGAAEQKKKLQAISNVEQARDFFGVESRDNQIDVRYYYDEGKSGFVLRKEPNGKTAQSLTRFKCNPWVQWTNDNGDQSEANKSGGTVRFVLAGVQYRKEGSNLERGFTLDKQGIIWIFEQEYNPKIKVLKWSRDDGGDKSRLVFNGECSEVQNLSENSYISSVDDKDINEPESLPDDPGDDKKINDLKKKYNLEGQDCTTDNGALGNIIKDVQRLIAGGMETVLKVIVGWITGIVDIGSLSKNPGLVGAWETFRTLVNLMFVVILIVIAFSNILRVDTDKYGMRSLLPRLVFAVIAVNFSFLLVQIMVNFAYILSKPFLNQSIALITDPPAGGSLVETGGSFGQFIVGMIALLIVIIALAVLLFVFIVRIVVIWIIAAFSPFVFFFMVLPVTRSLSGMWWKNAVKWIFMAPIAFMILFVASELISGGGNQNDAGISDPSWILKIGVFVGACYAAVTIPLKLGGEIMSSAAKGGKMGGKGLGKFGVGAAVGAAGGSKNPMKFARQGGAALEARKANQKQAAQLGAASSQARLSNMLGGTRLGRGVASTVTGGNAATVAAQHAGVVDKFASDISKDGRIGIAEQRQIANGEHGALTAAGQHGAASLARTKEGRQAAGRLLAQKGLLTQEYLDKMPSNSLRNEQFEAGNNKFMQNVDPMLAGLGPNQELSPTSEGIVTSAMASADPTSAKHFKFEHMADSLKPHHSAPRRRAAGAQLKGMQGAQVNALLDRKTSRTFVSEDVEREGLVEGLEHGLNNGFYDHDLPRKQEIEQAVTNYKTHGSSTGP